MLCANHKGRKMGYKETGKCWMSIILTVVTAWQVLPVSKLTMGSYSKSYVLSSSHVRMWELGHKESWVPNNRCFQIVVLEKTLENPLDCKKIKPVSPKGNQPWIFIERTDAEAEVPILWPLDAKSRLIGKDPNAGKDLGQEEKGNAEDEMGGWHHWLNEHQF